MKNFLWWAVSVAAVNVALFGGWHLYDRQTAAAAAKRERLEALGVVWVVDSSSNDHVLVSQQPPDTWGSLTATEMAALHRGHVVVRPAAGRPIIRVENLSLEVRRLHAGNRVRLTCDWWGEAQVAEWADVTVIK